MTIQGNIKTFYLSSLLQILADDKKTGVLRVSNQEDSISVYFREGDIIFATSSVHQEQLGYLLRSEGVLTDAELENCLKASRQRKHKLGKVLVDESYITADSLCKFIRLQVENILYSLFMWHEGRFQYEDAPVKFKEEIVTQIDTMEIVLEASRRVNEMLVLSKFLPDDDAVLRITDTLRMRDVLMLEKHELAVYKLIDSSRTVRQITDQCGYDSFTAAKALYALVSAGMAEINEKMYVHIELPAPPGEDKPSCTPVDTAQPAPEPCPPEPEPKPEPPLIDPDPILKLEPKLEPKPEPPLIDPDPILKLEPKPELTLVNPDAILKPEPLSTQEPAVAMTDNDFAVAGQLSLISFLEKQSITKEELQLEIMLPEPTQKPEESTAQTAPEPLQEGAETPAAPKAPPFFTRVYMFLDEIIRHKAAPAEEPPVEKTIVSRLPRFAFLAATTAVCMILAYTGIYYGLVAPEPGMTPQQIQLSSQTTLLYKQIKKKRMAAMQEAAIRETVAVSPQEQHKTLQQKKELDSTLIPYQDPRSFFFLFLPSGCLIATNTSAQTSEVTFTYPPNLTIRITARVFKNEWKADEEMYKKVLEIQQGKSSLPHPRIESYSAISFGGGKGYEINLAAIQGATHYKSRLNVLAGHGKILVLESTCWDCGNLKNQDNYNQVLAAMVKSLLLYP
jgi:hypothetical protein